MTKSERQGRADAAATAKHLSGDDLARWADERLTMAEACKAKGDDAGATRYLAASFAAAEMLLG